MRAFLDIFGQTLRTLWAHKLRSFLTMFGIAWGVGSLLLLVGLGEGFRSGQKRQLAGIGKDIQFVFPGRVPPKPGTSAGSRQYWLTIEDSYAIREAPHVKYVSPVINRQDIRAVSQWTNSNGQVFGVYPEYNQIRSIPLGRGRWFNEQDESQKRRVVVLGYQLQKALFPGRPAIGSQILLNGFPFEVIGVLDSIGKEEQNLTNSRLFLPFSTTHELFPAKDEKLKIDMPDNAVSFINYSPTNSEDHTVASEEVKRIVARRHDFDAKNDDAFEMWDTVKSSQMVGKIFDAMNKFLGSVGLVTLALGAIGIINIMLVSVSERTKEIGLRKALGATKRSILTQFFLEGAFLTLLSGLIGVVVAGGLMKLLSMLPQPPGFDTPRLVPWSAAVSMAALGICGIAAGLYPASKAANLEPVEALRQE
jgi:putative ABC transport system permease protein